jgi:two-component system response regulator FixJ
MNHTKPTVYLVDDDKSLRDSLRVLLKSASMPLVSFASAEEFLEAVPEGAVGCLLVDVRLPGMGGLELIEQLKERNIAMPVILLTGHADVPTAVKAIRAGALDFVEKPAKDKALTERLRPALKLAEKWRETQTERDTIAKRLGKLTPRERQVMEMLVAGKKNKMIAEELGISRKTLDIHRAKVMYKMEARTVADLVRWTYMDNPKLLQTVTPAVG